MPADSSSNCGLDKLNLFLMIFGDFFDPSTNFPYKPLRKKVVQKLLTNDRLEFVYLAKTSDLMFSRGKMITIKSAQRYSQNSRMLDHPNVTYRHTDTQTEYLQLEY